MKTLKYMLIFITALLVAVIAFRYISADGSLFSTLRAKVVFTGVLFFYLLIYRKLFGFWEVLIHEFTHLIIGVIFLRKIFGFAATTHEGSTIISGGFNYIIALSPYSIPLIPLLLLFFFKTFTQASVGTLSLVVYISYLFFLFRAIRQYSASQSDISQGGRIISTILILASNLFFYAFLSRHISI